MSGAGRRGVAWARARRAGTDRVICFGFKRDDSPQVPQAAIDRVAEMADIAGRDIEPAEYVGIFFSCGRAPEYIRDDPDLIEITRYYFKENKPVGCVCHGVEIPARAGCVEGRRMATVPKCQFDLEVCGGTFVNEPCVVDGNMVSGRTWHDHGHYMKHWINLLIAERERMLAQ